MRPAFHTATVIAPEHRPITFADLFNALKRIAPHARVGTWDEPDLPVPPADDPGIEMLMLDGQQLAVFAIDQPTPAHHFEIGQLVNIHMRDPIAVCRGHRGHVRVMRTKEPHTRAEALMLSRAVTLVACAVAEFVSALAIHWSDADHIVPPSIVNVEKLAAPMEQAPQKGMAPELWARLLIHAAPGNYESSQPLKTIASSLNRVGCPLLV